MGLYKRCVYFCVNLEDNLRQIAKQIMDKIQLGISIAITN